MTFPKNQKDPLGRRYSRGYLPHVDAPGLTQFITFRLAESLPRSFLADCETALKGKLISETEYRRRIEYYLDKGIGPRHLAIESVAACIAETIVKFHGTRYDLRAWVIMPNHVHLLFDPINGYALAQIMHSIKSFTVNFANRHLGLEGRFWSPEYFDRFIRDRVHMSRAKLYIENNPVKAGLCSIPEEWPWSNVGYRKG